MISVSPSMSSELSYVSDANPGPNIHLSQTNPAAGTAMNKGSSDQSRSSSVLQDADQAVPESPRENSKPETLTLAFPSVKKDGKDRYAVVPFPETYRVGFSDSSNVDLFE
jgi:hypothetical protein